LDYERRVARLREALDGNEIDALFVTNLTNVRYLTGFSGTNGQVLVTGDGAFFLTDRRYEARAADIVRGAEIVIYPPGGRLGDVLDERLKAGSIRRLGVEATTMTIAAMEDLDERLDGVGLVSTKNLVEELRRVKEPAEVEIIRRAAEITADTYRWALDRLVVGATERQIALDLEIHMREQGADEVSFVPIVGSGPLSAHMHHTPSDRAFDKGDFVLLDFGCRIDGYCSDFTRTVVLGAASDDQRAAYELVLRAHLAGIEAIRPGATGAEVDEAARAVIRDAGRVEQFGHGLGHGVGLDIHEAPTLRWGSEDTLEPGEVVTVEPGVYVVGSGGVRIEDCVVVTEDGAEVLGDAPKDTLLEL
jgi:Xaa-Pro aminopeptidase